MGRHCGFEFYKLVDGKFVAAHVVKDFNGKMVNWLNIDGRCEATSIFLNLIKSKESNNTHNYLLGKELLPKEKYAAYLILNHPELDGFEVPREIDENNKEFQGWFSKYFYFDLKTFKSSFDFEGAQKDHDECIRRIKDKIADLQTEIERLRKHQESSKTKAAFDGFEEKIQDLKENIMHGSSLLKDIEEDDYDYDHYMYIKEDFEIVESIIENDPEVIVVAYAND